MTDGDICLATRDARCCFEPMRFSRHAPGEHDVTIDVQYCGVCHSDVHAAKGELMATFYPICPGHEIAGVVTAVGSKVTKFKVGDHVGVGCFVDSCLQCAACKRGDENFCSEKGGFTATYSAKPVHGRAGTEPTKGGYSTRMVVNEHFAVGVPKAIPLEKAGPILCAGVTMYSPLVKYRVGKGSRVGINGLGGLGTMGARHPRVVGRASTFRPLVRAAWRLPLCPAHPFLRKLWRTRACRGATGRGAGGGGRGEGPGGGEHCERAADEHLPPAPAAQA